LQLTGPTLSDPVLKSGPVSRLTVNNPTEIIVLQQSGSTWIECDEMIGNSAPNYYCVDCSYTLKY